MEAGRSSRATRLELLDRCGWKAVADRVVHGIGHDLSGRASSMGGLAYLLSAGKGEGEKESLGALMRQELEILEGSIQVLRLLPDDSAEPELLVVSEMVEAVGRLVRTQRGFEEVEVRLEASPDAPALRGDRTLLQRSLALLLTRSAEEALLSGTGTVEVRVGGEGGRLALAMESPSVGENGTAANRKLLLPPLPPGMEATVSQVLEEEGIELKEAGSGSGKRALILFYRSPFSS